MSRAYIALGSNLGDRPGQIKAALQLLESASIRVTSVSRLHQTDPVDCPPGSPSFLNAAAALDTELSPRELLHRLLDAERVLGRQRNSDARNASRTIDLDLLLYDQLVVNEAGLIIPHPRMHQRRFVLAPLAEIAPELRHPVLNTTVGELFAELDSLQTQVVREQRAGR